MNLRSRDAIKPPKRYDGDKHGAPTPPPSACSEPRGYKSNVRRLAFPTPIVDFNPDLPPAAFPTIDCQQPHKHSAQETAGSSSNITEPMQERAGVGGDFGRQDVADCQYRAATNREKKVGGDGDVSMVDAVYNFSNNAPAAFNFQAGWGHANNPYQLGNSEHGLRSSANLHISDDENEVGMGVYEAAKMSARPLHPVKWSDISPTLQTEIFENLRSVCDFRHAAETLGLSPSEQVKMLAHSTTRKEQIQNENARLKEMRAKQLRALLRMDNSYLKSQKVPGQLVFRNISKKFLDTATRSDPDYSMSQASDILIARKYLRSLDLDPKLAGEWSNNLVTITTTGLADTDEDFEWTGELPVAEEDTHSEHGDTERESSSDSETVPDDSSPPDCSPNPKRQRILDSSLNAAQHILRHRRRESSVSRSGTSRTLPCRAPAHRVGRPQWLQSSRPLLGNFPQPSPLAHEPMVRLKVGAQGAARIQQDIFRSPGVLMQAASQPNVNFADDNAGSANQLPPTWPPQTTLSKDGSSKALKRTLAGPWLYQQNWCETETASRASRLYRDSLAAAKADAQAELRTDSACHISNSIFPYTNLMTPRPSNTYQIEGMTVEPPARWRNSPAGHGGNPETIPTVGANSIPHYMSLSNRPRMEREGPEYSPITPPSIEAQCKQNEKQPHAKKPEDCATLPADSSETLPLLTPISFPSPNNAEALGDLTGTSRSLTTNPEGPSAKQNSLHPAQKSVSPVPELEMTEANRESMGMEIDSVQEKHASSSTETPAPTTPNVNSALFCPKEKPSTPLNSGTTEKLPKRKTRRSGNGWTKRKQRPSSKPTESLASPSTKTTTQESTKKANERSNAAGVEATNSGRRRSTRVIKKAARHSH
ncbi:hypothetical protein ACJ73_03543 [Blastomyces percursus]|uniref:Uncharacterized protein n=1 Tax=Blastomyces percursus TaxID=1658174 RepID=A0A1J9R982_9EURO|nr:hypothetical protein ACJ73_03543 [Blastomyces percursus]